MISKKIMNLKYWSAFIAVLALTSCRTPVVLNRIDPEKNISVSENLPEDQNLVEVIAPYKTELEGKMNTRLSHTAVDLNKQGDNSNLGNLLADFTFEGAQEWAKKNGMPAVDAAVINIGGIRTSIGKGAILSRHIYEVMPFENEVVIVKMTGEQIAALFDYYRSSQKNNPVSRLVIETDAGKPVRYLIAGNPVNRNQTYYIATSDYLAAGGDNMRFFTGGQIINTGIRMRDLFMDKFKANPEVKAPGDLRLIFKNKPNRTNNE